MAQHDDLIINETRYDWLVRSFQAVEGKIGLNIKVHNNNDDLLNRGQIFLFNHFARFETLIPPYIIHRESGAYCRSVADHALFDVNDSFGSLLRGLGVVPNNLPGLLPFLAAEILRGRKVIIFPEGGMIKDRRVMDEAGQLRIFSPSSHTWRKHHRGAAVLGLFLELFKQRIKNLAAAKDEKRLEHWRKSLGLASLDTLLEQANKPTLIVPGTITFYPIRVDDNILTRGAEWFSKSLSRQLLDELSIEGNLLFKDTDMDIRLGEPELPKLSQYWWEKLLLSRYFMEINSLDDFFGLREHANRWTERLLLSTITRETDRIRDNYMEKMYAGITVNLSHLASVLIVTLLARGQREIPLETFHRTLYLALKTLQNEPGVHLHRSLVWPDRYRDLSDGKSPDLERFLDTCTKAGLIEKTAVSYRFLDKLTQEHHFHEVRLENPVLVTANEVKPVRQVQRAIDSAFKKVANPNPQELATHLFDDEIRAYGWCRAHFSKKRYHEINTRETATQNSQPYLLLPKGKQAKVGVVLVHGFLSSPAELRDFGEELQKQGYAVLGVRLAGHGTSPWDLHQRKWEDWLMSVRRGYRIMSSFVDKVVVVGFSTGADLSLLLAAEHPVKLAGIATVAAPLAVHDRGMMIVPIVHKINQLVSWIPSMEEGLVPFHANDTDYPDINYRSMPVQAINELRELMGTIKDQLPKITARALIIQGEKDPIVHTDSAQKIFNGLASKDKRLEWVDSDRHGLIAENVGNTRSLIAEFIAEIAREAESSNP